MNARELYMRVKDHCVQDNSGVYGVLEELADMIEEGYDFETWADDYVANTSEYKRIGVNQYEHVNHVYPKYFPEEVVIYQNGNQFELGVVKSKANQDDEYFVRYHMGDTAACTHAINLHKIHNSYVFQVIRKDVNSDITTQKARMMANDLIETIIEPFLQAGIEGDEYYELEDRLTDFIESYQIKETKEE